MALIIFLGYFPCSVLKAGSSSRKAPPKKEIKGRYRDRDKWNLSKQLFLTHPTSSKRITWLTSHLFLIRNAEGVYVCASKCIEEAKCWTLVHVMTWRRRRVLAGFLNRPTVLARSRRNEQASTKKLLFKKKKDQSDRFYLTNILILLLTRAPVQTQECIAWVHFPEEPQRPLKHRWPASPFSSQSSSQLSHK